MTAAVVPDFSISFSRRRTACVLDPTLALSDYGLPLAKQLGELVELWIVRELLYILDNPQVYLRQPELIIGQQATTPQQQRTLSEQIIRALREWDRLRTTTTLNINFLTDIISESCVPHGLDPGIIGRWESLAQSLDADLDSQFVKADTLTLAFRDLVALAAARPACILTYRPKEAIAAQPQICTMLTRWGIPCDEIPSTNPFAVIEREHFRTLLVHAGLSKLFWSGLDLVVLHLTVPAAATLGSPQEWPADYGFPDLEELADPQGISVNLWNDARAFWYLV